MGDKTWSVHHMSDLLLSPICAVVPDNDEQPHDPFNAKCSCGPSVEAVPDDNGGMWGHLYVHKAWDRRECIEQLFNTENDDGQCHYEHG